MEINPAHERIGRVNRIGTKATIYIYNFFPTTNVDSQINLEKRAIIKLQAFHTALGEDSQIYSPEEEFENFGLFEKAPEEERDEKLEFLDELRRFRRTNPSDYKIIRNLPLRARVGRKDRDREGSTFVFVRNARRNAFYRVDKPLDGDGNSKLACEELSFIEAARIFRATVKEKLHPIPSIHHGQVPMQLKLFGSSW